MVKEENNLCGNSIPSSIRGGDKTGSNRISTNIPDTAPPSLKIKKISNSFDDIAELWHIFCDFNACQRIFDCDNNDDSFAQFITRWQNKLDKLISTLRSLNSQFNYPEELIVLKLLAASHLDQDYVLDLLRLVFFPSLSDKIVSCDVEHLTLLERAILLIQQVKAEGEDKREGEEKGGEEEDEGGEGECVTVPGIKIEELESDLPPGTFIDGDDQDPFNDVIIDHNVELIKASENYLNEEKSEIKQSETDIKNENKDIGDNSSLDDTNIFGCDEQISLQQVEEFDVNYNSERMNTKPKRKLKRSRKIFPPKDGSILPPKPKRKRRAVKKNDDYDVITSADGDVITSADGEEDSSGPAPPCEKCGKLGLTVKSMRRHLRICQSIFVCKPCCNTKYPSKEKLEKHIRKHKPKTCQECQEVLPSEVAYKYHISYGSCAEKKMCRYCGKYFHPSYLLEHEANHKEVRRFPCPREGCDKSFHVKFNLDQHLAHHDGVRNWLCDHCEKKFVTWKDLRRHKERHERHANPDNLKKAAYTCSECDKKFFDKCKFEEHFRKHTGEKPFKCDVCDKQFSKKWNLKKHLQTIHKKEI